MFTIEDASTPRRAGDPSPRVDDAEEDFYDSGPESAHRRLVVVDPTSSGARAISRRQREVFGGRHATVISTDVQLIAGGGVLAVVLGTLSKGSSLRSRHRGAAKPVTFMHNFILERRVDADRADDRVDADRADARVDADAPPSSLDDFIIVNEVFRRVDPVASPAATAASVLRAALSPPPTPPRARAAAAAAATPSRTSGGANDGRRTGSDESADSRFWTPMDATNGRRRGGDADANPEETAGVATRRRRTARGAPRQSQSVRG